MVGRGVYKIFNDMERKLPKKACLFEKNRWRKKTFLPESSLNPTGVSIFHAFLNLFFLENSSLEKGTVNDIEKGRRNSWTGKGGKMMKCDDRKREMFSRRACSESGPHPGIPGGTGSGPGGGGGHLWGKRNQGRTSAPVVGHARAPAIILRTRRSWPVAPTHCRR